MAGKSLNRVQLIGNLGKDVELKYTPQGTAVTTLAIATNERFKDKSGEWQDRTEWHNVVCWQRLAEIAGEYLKKGGKVFIEGRLQTRMWEAQGKKNYKTEIVASDLILLGSKDASGDGSTGDGRDRGFDQRPAQTGREGTAVTEEFPITDEDIPF